MDFRIIITAQFSSNRLGNAKKGAPFAGVPFQFCFLTLLYSS